MREIADGDLAENDEDIQGVAAITGWDMIIFVGGIIGAGKSTVARGLAAHFDAVFATDASREQLEQSEPHPRVHYQLSPAEGTSLVAGSIDLITVAQAAHWFDLGRFYSECRRVARPGGILAVFSKFDGESVVGTAMQTGDVSFHNMLGAKVQALELSQRPRI